MNHPPSFKAIAAMSLNRVIGQGGQIPWHLPEDFQWFKKMTFGQVVVMGRKTFQSIGRPLPGRTTMILSRAQFCHAGVRTVADLQTVDWSEPDLKDRQIFICGGAEVYTQTMAQCTDLYLTIVKQTVDGDVFFPACEDQFASVAEIRDGPDFKILHYRRNL